jgi:hypothetical protein
LDEKRKFIFGNGKYFEKYRLFSFRFWICFPEPGQALTGNCKILFLL